MWFRHRKEAPLTRTVSSASRWLSLQGRGPLGWGCGLLLILVGLGAGAACRTKGSDGRHLQHRRARGSRLVSSLWSAISVAALPTDVLISAMQVLRDNPPTARVTDRTRVAHLIVRVAAMRVALMRRWGDGYRHGRFLVPRGGLARDSLYQDYVAWLRQYQRSCAGEVHVDPLFVQLLAGGLDPGAVARELRRRARRIVTRVTERRLRALRRDDRGSQVVFLDRETPLSARCWQSARAVWARGKRASSLRRLSLSRAQELRDLLGEQTVCAAVVDGKLITDMVTERQWSQALGVAPRPLAGLPSFFDAHLHLQPGGAARARRILSLAGGMRATVMTLLPTHGGLSLTRRNEILLEQAGRDGTFTPLVIIDPQASEAPVVALDAAWERGARGVKLLTGHGDYWETHGRPRLDPPALDVMFRRCAERRLPVLWHVNVRLLSKGALAAIARHPSVHFVLPHALGYLTFAPERVAQLLSRYPNLYVDLSFGSQPWYLRRALEDLSLRARAWRALIESHPSRFLFGTDLVVTPKMSLAHALSQAELHLRMLSRARYVADLVPLAGVGHLGQWAHHPGELNGLALSGSTLRLVLRENAVRLGLIRIPQARPGPAAR